MSEALAAQSERAQETRVQSAHVRKSLQAQINVRIDAGLKEMGDAGLAEAGYTPTQAVRALWSLAGRNRDDPAKIRAALEATDDGASADEAADRKRRREALERGVLLIPSLCAQYGLSGTGTDLGDLSDREYYDLLMTEHFKEKGLIDA